MPLHDTLARFTDIIRFYEVVQYEVAGPHARLKLKVVFANGTELYVREIILDGQRKNMRFTGKREQATSLLVGTMRHTG